MVRIRKAIRLARMDSRRITMKEYNPHEIEPRLQGEWAKADLFHVPDNDDKPKKYILEMFPYPSGDIHMGHARNYSIGDVHRPVPPHEAASTCSIPWAGTPSACPPKTPPSSTTAIRPSGPTANIATQKASFKRMGFSYDWDRTVVACDPEYYRWGQWIFEQFWKKRPGRAPQQSPVNWCPSCKTVLANEQVIEGRCWRCHSEVEKRDLTQWYFKITDYAQELLDDLDQLDGWPERVKQQQANWIGRSEGAEVDVHVLCDPDGSAPADPTDDDLITVFTTRADTLFGCSFFVLAPEYAGVARRARAPAPQYEQPVMDLVEAAKKVTAARSAPRATTRSTAPSPAATW
jgi:leucyl-tRNA synthetase